MKKRNSRQGRLKLLALVAACQGALPAYSLEFETGNADVKIQWDNTLKYSAGYRLKERSATLVSDPNQDDGDRNFDKGAISNRLDLLSEFDLRYQQKMGLRVSGAAWHDTLYRQSNDNDSAATANNLSVPFDRFNTRTRNLHGGASEILDAFVYANGDIGGMAANLRLGRHSLLYGESLFFGSNGIAAGQAPIDVIKLLSVPNSQFKEIVRPVSQLSTQLQVNGNVTIGGYYQFEWRKTLIPSAGSYFSTADVLEGGERFLAGPPFPPGAYLLRRDDEKARNGGQGGVQLRWRPAAIDAEFGFYATRYHDKTPQVYLSTILTGGAANPAIGQFGEYRLAYAEDIRAYGASFSTQLGDFNVAGEASVRRNTPLVSDPTIFGVTTAAIAGDNRDSPAYAVGNSAHAQLSAIYIVPRSSLWNTANFLGELAWNRRTAVTRNPEALAANASRDAWAMRFIFEPSWFQAAPGLDLSVPVGLGYSTHGNSSVVAQFNPGGKDGGDLSVGVRGQFRQVWRFGLNYTHFIGEEGTGLDAKGQLSFKQSLRDRDFVSLTVQRSF